MRFEAPALASRCSASAGGGVVLQGATGGNGVLVWLRYHDSLAAGEWPLIQGTDTVSPRGAQVGVRFMIGALAHGVGLDSGAVRVSKTGRFLAIGLRGSGLEAVGAVRVALDARFDAVPLGRDTVSCRPVP